jgi:hypothetical protein
VEIDTPQYGKFTAPNSIPKIGMSLKMMSDEEGWPLWVQARGAVGTRRHLKTLHEGDIKEGILITGQDMGGITDLPTVNELFDRIIAEAKAQVDKIENGWI